MSVKDELSKIVTSENVLYDEEILARYSNDQSFVNPVRPQCVVKPDSTEQVQELVKWANDTLTPLVPVSSGTPRFRGDTIPGIGGAVIVDLQRMNRIIRVDRKNRLSMIEPGVTFGELTRALVKEDLFPYLPLAPRQSKSVVASCLEREPITTPLRHWEAQDPLLCAQIVYGSGDLFASGSASGPGTIEEQWAVGRAQVRGSGPSSIGFNKLIQGSQGTMGIVTWITLKCKVMPKANKTFLIPSNDLKSLIDFIYKILWKKLGDQCLILNAHNMACLLAHDAQSIMQLRDVLPPWVLVFSIEGSGLMPQERVEYQQADFTDLAQAFGLEFKPVLPEVKAEDVENVLSKPSDEPYWKLRFQGGCHDIFFLTTLDKTPRFIEKMYGMAHSHRYPAIDIGIYIQPTMRGANCHCEFNLSYAPSSRQETDKVRALDTEAVNSFINMGGFFSRPYGPWADPTYARAAMTMIGQRKIKEIFDPKSIMNPGKLCF